MSKEIIKNKPDTHDDLFLVSTPLLVCSHALSPTINNYMTHFRAFVAFFFCFITQAHIGGAVNLLHQWTYCLNTHE